MLMLLNDDVVGGGGGKAGVTEKTRPGAAAPFSYSGFETAAPSLIMGRRPVKATASG
jgi:hypothetical protein